MVEVFFMEKISVIMPCLNVADYIAECLESVRNQIFTNLEILVVDAGSTDGTLAIVENMAMQDSRIRLLSSPKKSYGYQMNLAIVAATGDYIGVVETDDAIAPDMYEVLYRAIASTDAEFVKAKADPFVEWNGEIISLYEIVPCQELEHQDKVIVCPREYPYLFHSDNFLWNGLYRTDYLRQFRFRETPGAAFQDIGFLFQLISNARQGIYLNKVVYHYRQDNFGASSYNHKSMFFIRDEYGHIEPLLKDLPANWTHVYYQKMASHLTDRFFFMGSEGVFWEEARDSVAWLTEKLQAAIAQGIITPEDFSEEKWKEIQLVLNDPHKLFDYERAQIGKWGAAAEATLSLLRGKRIVLFGSGQRGEGVYKALRIYGMEVVAFCDNSIEKQGQKIGKLPILAPAEAVKTYPDAYFIVANKEHWREMREQLMGMGVSGEQISGDTLDLFGEGFTNKFTVQMILRGALQEATSTGGKR